MKKLIGITSLLLSMTLVSCGNQGGNKPPFQGNAGGGNNYNRRRDNNHNHKILFFQYACKLQLHDQKSPRYFRRIRIRSLSNQQR